MHFPARRTNKEIKHASSTQQKVRGPVIIRYLGRGRAPIRSRASRRATQAGELRGRWNDEARTRACFLRVRAPGWTERSVVEFQRAALDCMSPGSPLPLLQRLIRDTSSDTWLRVPQPYISIYIHSSNPREIKGVFF